MCLLTFFPEGIHPDVEALARGARFNADGHGFAIVVPAEGGRKARIIVRKSMKATSLIKEFALMRQRYPKGPALFHSRITTDGETNLFNCHPFMHSGDKRTVIGHNGILPASVRPDKDDVRSDTRIFAEEVAGVFRLHTVLGRRLAGEWMGDGNKIVILTVDPVYNSHAFIVNASSGMWDKGIWYSNTSYQGWRASSSGAWGDTYWYGTTKGKGWSEWAYCELACGARSATVSPYTGVCTVCHHCSLCYAKPCECELEPASGKGQPLHRGSSAAEGTVIGGSPGKGATVDDGSPEHYVATVEEYEQVLAEIEELGRENQLQEAIALVNHLNNGGELDDWPEESTARRTVDSWLAEGDAVLVDGTIRRSAELVKSGDPADDQDAMDYLIHNG